MFDLFPLSSKVPEDIMTKVFRLERKAIAFLKSSAAIFERRGSLKESLALRFCVARPRA
ncbi:unnamed protein product [marine sediment metagenome]|uniref:Uncharacterized protein n=1 Tax=marine sediment metagenome TaxID=412755 RepID=X1TW45_9ZZZZ